MKVALGDISSFAKLFEGSEEKLQFSLVAGGTLISDLKLKQIFDFEEDKDYDQEMLNNIFTFREIFWQPLEICILGTSVTLLNVFKNYMSQQMEISKSRKSESLFPIYEAIFFHIMKACDDTTAHLKANPNQIRRVLGDFRILVIPSLFIFIRHKRNKKDFQIKANNRLNFAVKLLITDYRRDFSELDYPFWQLKTTPTDKIYLKKEEK